MRHKLLTFVCMLLFVNDLYAMQVIRDIPYTYNDKRTLDLFIPDVTELTGNTPRPAAIVMHFGGLMGGVATTWKTLQSGLQVKGLWLST